jgi:hypothetical protein
MSSATDLTDSTHPGIARSILGGDVMMLKALISGVSHFAYAEVEPAEQEPLKRMCAYVEAVGAFLLLTIVATLIF